jgi:hypothetical protein
MRELTREQESAIARLAIDHPSVAVEPQEDGTVKVTAGGRTQILDENGNATAVPIESVPIRLPISTLRRLLGSEAVALAVAEAQAAGYAYPDHGVGMKLSDKADEAIVEALNAALRARTLGAA